MIVNRMTSKTGLLPARKIRKACCVLVATGIAACLTAGCGDELVHTSADAQTEDVVEQDTAEAEKTDADETQETDVSGQEASEESDTTDTSSSEEQEQMDEETRKQLTEELLEENKMDTSVIDNSQSTKGCAFSLPDDFVESEDMPGIYVTERYPIDASTISYSVLEQDISLQLMTEENFKAQTQEAFRQAYDEDIELIIDEFKRIEIDGYPAFRILCHYQVDDVEITQLEYAINADKSYVVTYSQTSEYDRMGEYEASAATIRIE